MMELMFFFFFLQGVVNELRPTPARQSVIPRGYVEIAPKIYVPNIPAGGSNTVSTNLSTKDDIRMTVMDENQELADTG